MFHVDTTLPLNVRGLRWVLVFGSNEAGRHGRGAALEARLNWGALDGHGRGRFGNSYATPTKDRALRPRPLAEIAQDVAMFLTYVEHREFSHPEERFWVTRIGCGLAGFSDAEIAPLFKGASDTCSFAHEWERYLCSPIL